MPTPPHITLTATLDSILGGAGPAPGPLVGFLEITLCGYGPFLPRVIGTGMLADAGIPQVEGPSSTFSVFLFGNDQITPAGTFYSIAVLDENKNVIQVDNYELTGIGTFDLSSLTPIVNPGTSTPSGYIIILNANGAVVADSLGWNGPLTIDIALTGDSTINLLNLTKGQIVQFIIRQDGAGGHNFTFPAIVKNPALTDPDPNSVSTSSYIVDYHGNLYPQLAWS